MHGIILYSWWMTKATYAFVDWLFGLSFLCFFPFDERPWYILLNDLKDFSTRSRETNERLEVMVLTLPSNNFSTKDTRDNQVRRQKSDRRNQHNGKDWTNLSIKRSDAAESCRLHVWSPGSCSKKCIFWWPWVFIEKTILEEHCLETTWHTRIRIQFRSA